MTLKDYFDRQTKRMFPLPKKLKPYTKTACYIWGDNTITVSLKASGSGKIELTQAGEQTGRLYLQATDWRELLAEREKLKTIIKKGG